MPPKKISHPTAGGIEASVLLSDLKSKLDSIFDLLQQIKRRETVFDTLKDVLPEAPEEGDAENIKRRSLLFLLCKAGELIKYFDASRSTFQSTIPSEELPAETLSQCAEISKHGQRIVQLRNEIIHHFRYEEVLYTEGNSLSNVLIGFFPHEAEEKPLFLSACYSIDTLEVDIASIQAIHKIEGFRASYTPGKKDTWDYFTDGKLSLRGLKAYTLYAEIVKLLEQLITALPAPGKELDYYHMAALNRLLHVCNLAKDLKQDVEGLLEKLLHPDSLMGKLIVPKKEKKSILPIGTDTELFSVYKDLIHELDHCTGRKNEVLFESHVLASKNNGNLEKLLQVARAVVCCEMRTYRMCHNVFRDASGWLAPEIAVPQNDEEKEGHASSSVSLLPAKPVSLQGQLAEKEQTIVAFLGAQGVAFRSELQEALEADRKSLLHAKGIKLNGLHTTIAAYEKALADLDRLELERGILEQQIAGLRAKPPSDERGEAGADMVFQGPIDFKGQALVNGDRVQMPEIEVDQVYQDAVHGSEMSN